MSAGSCRRPHCFVILGAAVWPGGEPSRAMRRRVEAAVEAWRQRGGGEALFLPTGGVGRFGPSEASVMRDLLVEAGVDPARVVLEEQGTDTFSSLRGCAEILGRCGAPGAITLCTDAYHLLRCRTILRLLGVRVTSVAVAGSRAELGTWTWLRQWARELAGLPWDVLLAVWHRLRPGRGRSSEPR
jgi:vancomycin permeability regulator SanA